MDENVSKVRLQETRKNEIPETIKKYKTLIDGIFSEVSKAFPVFKNIEIKDEQEVVIKLMTAEEQLYNFMLMREKAIDHADRMLNKINMLELELNCPDLFLSDAAPKGEEEIAKKSWVKKQASQK